MIPDFTAAVGAPRVAAIAHPTSRPLGNPGDADGQRAVLEATLRVLEQAKRPGSVVRLPFTWPESAKDVRRQRHGESPPIGKLIKRKPWLYLKLVSGDIPTKR